MKPVPFLNKGCTSTSTMSSVFALADVLRSLLFLNSFLLMSSSSLGMSPTSELPGSSSREEYNNIGPSSCVTAFINTTYTDRDNVSHTSNNESGKYGETYVGPASGRLIHVRSEDNEEPTACSLPLITFSTDDYKLPTSEPWIALIKRGHCDFAVKVMNALRSNATAVLIYNDREAPTLDKMSIPSDLRNISAVFTFKKKGENLAALVDQRVRVMTYITVGNQCTKLSANINRLRPFVSSSLWFVPPPENVYKENKSAGVPDDDLNGSGTSVLFVSISFIVLMIISLAWLVFYYVQRFRYIHAKDRLSRRLCSAAKKALSKIPTKNIKSEDKEIQGDGECCAVCIEPYKISDILRILPCRHEFHKFCIDPWLLEHRTCPMCKMDILKHYGFVFTGSQESILHMEIEEVAGLGSGVNNDTDRLQRRTLNPATQIRPSEHQISSSASPEVHSRSSRASSPDELTPTLCSEQCYMGATSRTGESPSLMETSTQYSSAAADALQKPEKCSNCLGITVLESVPTASSVCDTSYKCSCELRQTPSYDIEDCELESCDSLTASLNTSPSHENSVKTEQANRVFSGK